MDDYTNPPRFQLRPKQDHQLVVDINDLLPHDENPLDKADAYNPFHYCYKIILDELGIEVLVKFEVDNYDYENKSEIVYKDRDGTEHRVPFFPQAPQAIEHPEFDAVETTNITDEDGGRLYMYPTIVRAKIYGDNVLTEDELIPAECVKDHISPERLNQAIIDYYHECLQNKANGVNVPEGLLVILSDYVQGSNIPDDEEPVDGDWEDDEDDYDEDEDEDDEDYDWD